MTPKRRWNLALLLDLATDLADREGLASLTLTRLATEMGIRPPSLFNHVRDRDHLVLELARRGSQGLADAVVGELERYGTPAERLHLALGAYRTWVGRHSGLYEATLAVPRAVAFTDSDLKASEGRLVSASLDLAREFGLEGDDAVHTVRGWRALTHGFCELERRGGWGLPLDVELSWQKALEALTPGSSSG